VVAVATDGNESIRHDAEDVILVPRIGILRRQIAEPLEDGTPSFGFLSGVPA